MSPIAALRAARRSILHLARRLGRRVIFGVPAALLVVALPGAWLTGSVMVLTTATGLLALIMAMTMRDTRTNRITLAKLRARPGRAPAATPARRPGPAGHGLEIDGRRVDDLAAELERNRRMLAVTLRDVRVTGAAPPLPPDLVPAAVAALLERGDALDAHSLATSNGTLTELDPHLLRRLREELRQRGFLHRALDVARVVERACGDQHDRRARRMLDGEIAVLSGTCAPCPPARDGPTGPVEPRPGRVLHLVGRSLPDHQVGYTLRTHHIALAQQASGLDVHVATQTGASSSGIGYARQDLDGITYHRIPGRRRGEVPLDQWLRGHVQRVANLVRTLRPAVLHAASDFLNAQTALAVGRAYGLPVVYESRGFWEETWLSRTARQYGWDPARVAEAHGLPDAYVWRRELEDRSRRDADRVVTLDPVMADRIEAGGVPRDRITVVPNGVAVERFPVVGRDPTLAARLGISEQTTTIGYISSLVEYEGIDTLLAAYAELARDQPVRLLIVGDGPMREQLAEQAVALGVEDVVFTGQVPHDEVLDWYGMIDIFVVPRRPVDVCHLVTPMKPFEAFATGRAVVLSNVRALASIAAQSNAAVLFEAGDPASLAAVFRELIADPDRRQALAATGAAWVRAERQWTTNARRYLRLYEELGALRSGTHTLAGISATDIDVEQCQGMLEGRVSPPFEQFQPPDPGNDAESIMTKGWSLPPYPPVSLDLPIDWRALCQENRSRNFHLHAWDFMEPVLRAHAATGDRELLDWCVSRAVSWSEQFTEGDASGTMAWYDMALGLRGHRLAYLTEQAVRARLPRQTISTLLGCVLRHQREFFRADACNLHTNHGLFVALGELAFSRRLRGLPAMDLLERQARERLATTASSQFHPDGGHVEHSPDYHRMVLAVLTGALRAGLIDDPAVRARVTLAEDVLGWLVQPDGVLVQVGDSPARRMRAEEPITASPTTAFHLSGGVRGEPDRRTLLVLPQTGYAIVRSPQPTGTGDHCDASYLFFTAAFHSRTHKHADDLSLSWFDRRQEILIDAGRYGYIDLLPADSPLRERGFFYSAPERRYVESTCAHNTVEVDGTDHQRRGRQPYGSGVAGGAEQEGHYRLRGYVDHGHWQHEREIVLLPGRWLCVTDWLWSTDGAAHDFRVWWNFPAGPAPIPGPGACLRVNLAGGGVLRVRELGRSSLIKPVSGQLDPMRGWRSRCDLELTPAWSAGFEALGIKQHVFRTLFRLDGGPMLLPTHPFDAL